MGVWNEWRASCETCNKVSGSGHYSQANLIQALRWSGWKCKRVAQPNGYTKLTVTCPDCVAKAKE